MRHPGATRRQPPVLLTLLGVALYGLVLGLERVFVVKDVRLQ
jgi:NitT/TauT family transport system permease protein